MLRFYFVIIVNIFFIIYYVPKMARYARHTEKYSEKECYELAIKVIKRVQKSARITTEYYGTENLPENDGYIMFSNHQGKYDALGIMTGHSRPCTVLMDSKRSNIFIAKQFVDLIKGLRLDKESVRQQMRTLHTLADEVSNGRNYLVFPEGKYDIDQGNRTGEFKYGCFISAIRAKCPIVPVTVIDSYKPFGVNSLKPVKTKVIFSKPIRYEDYKGMKAQQISDMVKSRIDAEIEKWTSASVQ